MSFRADDPALPKRWEWLCGWFTWYCQRFAAKHFHAVRLSLGGSPLPVATGEPLLFVMNHPSWWDIIIGAVLSRRLATYRHYAPIDSDVLPQYRFFDQLGFFGVESTPRGAARFLRTAQAVFEQPFGAMWVTAQGKFVDPRARPIELRAGVGYVASRLHSGLIVPVAVEYPFWSERTPEALVRIGAALRMSGDREPCGREWTARIEAALTATQDELAVEAMKRDPALFTTLAQGKVGIGGPYDIWRRFKSWARLKRFDPSHAAAMKLEER